MRKKVCFLFIIIFTFILIPTTVLGDTNSYEVALFENATHKLEPAQSSSSQGLDEIYKYEGGDTGKVTYPTIFGGGCPSDVGVFKLFGVAYNALKIIAPVILVVFATIDLAKAVASSDEGMIKKAQKHCLKRIAAAVIVLLSFVVIQMFVQMVSNGSDVMGCVNSMLN